MDRTKVQREWDELAKEDHTYRLTPQEKKRHQGQLEQVEEPILGCVMVHEPWFDTRKLERFKLADVLSSAFNSRILHQNVQSARDVEC